MSRMDTIGTTATKVRTEQGMTFVRYHNTDVVTVKPETITLNSGGWFTKTTKTRMNQASNQFGLGFSVVQTNGVWFVHNGNEVLKFEGDIITFNRRKA